MAESRVVVRWVALAAVLAAAYLVVTHSQPVFDLRADRLVSLAALDGLNPYVPVTELSDRYGSTLGWTHVHPRTPGALVLQFPLALLTEEALRPLAAALTAIGVVGTVAIALRLGAIRTTSAVVAALAVGVSSVAVEAVAVGAQSPILALLLAGAWWSFRAEKPVAGGVALGVATALKVFTWPLILLLALRGHHRGAGSALVTAAGLNLAGLMFPGVGFTDAIGVLATVDHSDTSALNGSIVRLIGGTTVTMTLILGVAALALAVWLGRTGWSFDRVWFAALAGSLLCAPLIWRHYLLVLVPAALWLALRTGVAGRVTAGLFVGWLLIPFPVFTVWTAVPLCFVVLLAAATAKTAARDPVAS